MKKPASKTCRTTNSTKKEYKALERSNCEVYAEKWIIENDQAAKKNSLKKVVGYYRRSLVETKMHYIKLLGNRLTAKNFPSQVNEIHAPCAAVLLKY